MATKTKEQIKAYLNQCGQLDYNEFIDFIDSVMFDDGDTDIAPICQVTRYKRFRNQNQAISLPNLFDEDNGLLAVYVKRLSEEPFTLKIGITNGGDEITSHEVDEALVSVDCTYLFSAATPVYITGLSSENIADIIVVYNSFLCDDNGDISMTLLEEIQNKISDLEIEITQTKDDLQSQINTLADSLIQIPTGIVVQWNGTLANIPTGWQRYTGNGSWFLIGESSTYPAGATGGEKEVRLTSSQQGSFEVAGVADRTAGSARNNTIEKLVFSTPGINGTKSLDATATSGAHQNLSKISVNISQANDTHNNMPPYKSVIYIEKI
ncbi:hypothetical protein FAZ19_16295 [Sphingobacterium alkalisoli]|uniref:Tail fiber protein n=1 Tax=Sphingobacterium alkalisoli TaxID=1874115 RepID=A0A4U0GXG0_9SPHI|nr:hypothetical protein [Sphingobacterium alkalisoli]TJY63827.1 hypothetical protein FAZ19_16295 [Sphingobacterium alkalisoli]GGH24626.1 hypothetical protein GCM10011418_32670 [Sphingobacterium alkalisoli]